MAITLAQLRTRAKVPANLQNSAFLTDAEWNEYINDAIRALYADVIAVNNDFRVTSTNFTISNIATPSTSLPADFMSVRGVIRDFNTTNEEWLDRFPPRVGRGTYIRSYRLQGSLLVIEPRERSLGTYTLLYNPTYPALTADGNNLDVELEQWQEYVVLHTAIKALATEESDYSQWVPPLAQVQSQVKAWAASQRSSDPDTVEDVRMRRRLNAVDVIP